MPTQVSANEVGPSIYSEMGQYCDAVAKYLKCRGHTKFKHANTQFVAEVSLIEVCNDVRAALGDDARGVIMKDLCTT